ncbi:hypothetical protein BG003_003116 [Podila horticola]|nr:hypothetical protein BG003_003116 [Podila horticola]
MGVFGEKHTSLTREQKRQLINHADTHKLRPTEVCDWVLATWGLRIARVTVYSILHKQRASLMAGHRDLYQTMQNSINGAIAAASGSSYGSSSFTNTQATSEDSCLDPSKSSGRVAKGRAGKRARSNSSDLPTLPPMESSPGEGARWEGQLKRVREPASVELDRAMVEFLKSSASVDAHGRRLNDAELQSHALRLAREIPSASRMRCSFGWLRHFKRRLGVQWAADRLGRYRWIVEMDQSLRPSTSSSSCSSTSARVNAGTQATSTDAHQTRRQDRVKEDSDPGRHQSNSRLPSSPESSQQDGEDDDEDDLEYHSSSELFGKESESTSSPSSIPSKHTRSTSISTSSTTASYSTAFSSQLNSRRSAQDLLGHQPSSFALASQTLSSASLAHPSHSTFLNLHPSSLAHNGQQSPSILDSFPSLFDSLPPLHNSIPTTVSSSQLLLNNNLASSLANPLSLQADSLNTSNATKTNPSQFGMSVDGGMRKVPSKDEAYDMLQSLLLYYEQDHHYIGEQQTLLLPRWIHQQRQIMHSDENDARMMWMRQQSLVQPTLGVPPLTPTTHNHHHHHAPASSTSSPPLSPLSPLPMSPLGSSATTATTPSTGGLEHFGVSAFPSLTSTIEQQMFFAHQQALQQQFALHQQHQQQQQQRQQQQSLVFQNL